MIGTSVCYVSVLLLLQQFIRSRRSLFFRLMMTFSSCLHGFLRDQNFQTDRIPLTYITVLLNDLWTLWPRMNGVDLRNNKSGSADLLTSATNGSQLRIYDGIPQTTHQTVKLQTVHCSLSVPRWQLTFSSCICRAGCPDNVDLACHVLIILVD